MGSNLIKNNESYRKWIQEISSRFRQSQISAAFKVNDEMLRFYWSLGRDMEARKDAYAWGSHFYQTISQDLKQELPDVQSFSPRNLLYMHQFYRLFPEIESGSSVSMKTEDELIAKQVVSQLPEAEIAKQPVSRINAAEIFLVPWGHMIQIINKCGNDRDKALFYVRKTFENKWSRAVLMNFLDTDLYARQGKAVTNFALTLPDCQSDLAQAITRDPYNFDFLTIREKYDEKELKDALMDNITHFLLEMGNGFSFVGREVRLEIGDTENFMDMLFYNIPLHCYVVVEVKVKEFDSGDMGQLGTYMVAVNHQLKGKEDGPTLGLLICRSKDNVKAQYALEASSQPMGISQYEISSFLPEKYKSSLPTIEEIEAELSDSEGGIDT